MHKILSMKEEEHYKAYQEHREAIFKWALEIRGLGKSQRIVGTHASRAIVELLSMSLHKKKLVDEGFQLNHRWFKTEKVADRLPEFKNKVEIVKGMVALENSSETLSYGAPRPVESTKRVVELFNELEEKIKAMMNE